MPVPTEILVSDLFPHWNKLTAGYELREAITNSPCSKTLITVLGHSCIKTQVKALKYLFPEESVQWTPIAKQGKIKDWLTRLVPPT